MKSPMIFVVFVLSVLVGCSHVDTKRVPASSDNKSPCGLEGSTDERIEDCSHQEGSKKAGFVLVSRSRDFKEIHQDIETGILWSDRFPSAMKHQDALKACATLKGNKWKLPSVRHYRIADRHGIRDALPNMSYRFWSVAKAHLSSVAQTFYGLDGKMSERSRDNRYSVRCVAGPEKTF